MGFGVESLNKDSLASCQIAITKFDGLNSTADFVSNNGGNIVKILESDRQKLQALFKNLLKRGESENGQLSRMDIIRALERITIKLPQINNQSQRVPKNPLGDYFSPSSKRYPDYVPVDSPLGAVLGRTISDYRPVDDMYTPVYEDVGFLGQRKIVGYRKISPQERRTLYLQ